MANMRSLIDETGHSLEQQMPDVYRQLLEVRDRIEKHLRDICDIEFTIQEGRLFILNVRPGKRTPRANLVILLHFLLEGKIGIRDVLTRVRLADVEDFCRPEIHNLSSLRYLGQGLPACGGAATGEIALDSTVALRLARQGCPFVLVRNEVNPEDIEAIRAAQGVVTARGGMTSHAAIVCRGWEKPCVAGFGEMELGAETRSMHVRGHGQFDEGEWITLNGTTGRVYIGKGDVSALRWQDRSELALLSQVTELAIKGEDVPPEAVGRTWTLRDFFAHNIPLRRATTSKRPSRHHHAYISFVQPTSESLEEIRQGLAVISDEEQDNYSTILVSMTDTLSRLLSASLGIGNHPLYFRPLWDPKATMRRIDEYQCTQLIGFEFFGINRHIPHLLDIATISFILEVELRDDHEEWFLDFTNPNGESLVTGATAVKSYMLRLNDARVSHEDIPLLYNTLRRREYEWQFYQSNDTTHAEIIQFLESWPKGCPGDGRLMTLCFELGLLRGHALTLAGESLVGRCHRSLEHEHA
jgi:phosphohistidine swiveling domain-containing protein